MTGIQEYDDVKVCSLVFAYKSSESIPKIISPTKLNYPTIETIVLRFDDHLQNVSRNGRTTPS